jgi:hypothetical protein
MKSATQRVEPALRGLFDHAGMFPPATLPFEAVLADAARFPVTLNRPGLLGADLVLAWKDWARLDEAALRKAGFTRRPCRVALVGLTPRDFADAAPAIAPHAPCGSAAVQVVSIEVHVEAPDEERFLRILAAWPVESGAGRTYVEPRMPNTQLAPFLPGLARLLAGQGKGLKLRCAGAHSVDRPTLAAAITAVSGERLPFKLTQGLHHPVPRPGFPNGFLNVLAALRLRQKEGARFDVEMHACLGEQDLHAFSLRDGIAWRGHRVTTDELAHLPLFAIGSCSLGEPDEDLMAAFGPAPST